MLAVSYPIISHIGVMLGYPRFAILWLGALFLVSGLLASATHVRAFSVITGSTAIVIAFAFNTAVNGAALRLPPIAMIFGLAASPFWWSLFTNLINYLIIAGVFVIEYPIRRRILNEAPHLPFCEYLVSMARLNRFRG